MSALTAADFPEFFRQAHQPAGLASPGNGSPGGQAAGPEPFRWQARLLDRVIDGGWPALVDVPTGLGKTAVIDVAVFAAALDSVRCPRRVFFVVDRRLVVDEAYEHARAVSAALATADPASVAGRVAAALRIPGDDGPALEVTRMRGGVTWSWLWLERPDRHAVITGTVDQIGSRLFFRGYGVGGNLRPIDAALAGTDSLIIIDEAHLSEAFAMSAQAAFEQDTTPPAARPVIVTMSASPGHRAGSVHAISDDEDSHPVAARRLHAAKRLWLADVPATRRSADQQMADAHAAWAQHLAVDGSVVGVIVNTVARARAVFERLTARHPDRCVLLTGRARAVDRQYLLHDWYGQIRAGRPRGPGEPLFVVATQTIEVGANIDLDALITETASLPALLQRLGRLNRLGELPGSRPAPAVVLHADADTDGVYGPARNALRQWLALHTVLLPRARQPALPDRGGLDVSPAALRQLTRTIDPQVADGLREPRAYTPVMFPSVLDTWASTSPVPCPDVPVDPFLHGIDRDPGQVSIVWRDLPGDARQWAAAVSILPPTAEETIEVPVAAARRWLTRAGGADDIGDLDAGTGPDTDGASAGPRPGPVLRYRSRDDADVISAADVRPGDLIVVPAVTGGCDAFGWNPGSTQPVLDVADLAAGMGRRHVTVRLGPPLIAAVSSHDEDLAAGLTVLTARVRQDIADGQPAPGTYADWLHDLLGDGTGDSDPLPHLAVLRRLARAKTRLRIIGDAEAGTVLLTTGSGNYPEDDTAAGSSLAARQISLRGHQDAVRARAREFAERLGLGKSVADSVALAAHWHDEGKRDPRFQAMLHGGDRWAAAAAEDPLAKSGIDPSDRAAMRRARRRSGCPPGMRHEALSAQIARRLLDDPDLDADVDRDLVLHLVASHHGRSRPLLPPITDPEPCRAIGRDTATLDVDTSITVDWSAPSRFSDLNQRYGRWGLARLEAIVRLADIWCSAREESSQEEDQ